MRKDFGKKPWLYPLPVLIVGTYNPDGTPNAMNAAWGGLYDSDQVVLCLSAGHKTTHNIEEREAFTVSFATADQMAACDYVGMVSGNDTSDKLAKTGWHVTKSSKVDAPLFDELPLTLECRYLKHNEDGNIIGEMTQTANRTPPSCARSPLIRWPTPTGSWVRMSARRSMMAQN